MEDRHRRCSRRETSPSVRRSSSFSDWLSGGLHFRWPPGPASPGSAGRWSRFCPALLLDGSSAPPSLRSPGEAGVLLFVAAIRARFWSRSRPCWLQVLQLGEARPGASRSPPGPPGHGQVGRLRRCGRSAPGPRSGPGLPPPRCAGRRSPLQGPDAALAAWVSVSIWAERLLSCSAPPVARPGAPGRRPRSGGGTAPPPLQNGVLPLAQLGLGGLQLGRRRRCFSRSPPPWLWPLGHTVRTSSQLAVQPLQLVAPAQDPGAAAGRAAVMEPPGFSTWPSRVTMRNL